MTLSHLPSFLAQAAAPAAGGGPNTLIMMVLMFIIMYFLLIRPQRLRQKEMDKLIAGIKVGDHVILGGGEHGIITSVKEKTIMVKVADNVKIEYERSSVASVLKKSDVVEATTSV